MNTVKRLKLTDCLNITGDGLSPLCGSVALEQIDLSRVGMHQGDLLSRHAGREPLISADHVIPVLDSIVGEEGSSLNDLQLPKFWHQSRMLDDFLTRYIRYLQSQPAICSECQRDGEQYIDKILLSSHSENKPLVAVLEVLHEFFNGNGLPEAYLSNRTKSDTI